MTRDILYGPNRSRDYFHFDWDLYSNHFDWDRYSNTVDEVLRGIGLLVLLLETHND